MTCLFSHPQSVFKSRLLTQAEPRIKIILLEIMLSKVQQRQFYCLFICLVWSIKGWCSPWIGTLEPQLHQDLQVLVEWGVLDASVSTYPVPWKGIAGQLETLQLHNLSSIPAISAQRLKHYLQAHKKQTGQSVISLYGATDDSRFMGFNGVQAKKVKLNITQEFYAGRWSGQISANYERSGKSHFDQSFLAYQFGDWNLRVGSLNQWWGPAQSSSLIMSNNARPVPSISFSRSQATRSQNQWLQYLGPWFFTAQVGQLESQRAVPDTKLWMTRFNFSPVFGLEVGLSWSAMWGGGGQASSVGDWFKVVTFQTECVNGEATCDDALETKLGNHIAGFDFKYSLMLFEQPFSLYGQRIGEDAVDYYRVTDNANLFGISTYLWGSKVYAEASDTNVACSNSGSDVKNCYYEHGTYQSGYRRYDRAIGSTFDTDAKMLSVGINKHFSDGDLFDLVVNRLTLNKDQQKPSPILNGLSEKIFRMSGFYQMHYGNWLVKLGASIEHAEVDDADSETDALLFTEFKYRLN
jgi:hypothetical protein